MLFHVHPVIDPAMRGLCVRSYPGHPNGCPNYGKRPTCPPQAPLLTDVYDLEKPCFLLINEFDLGAHVERMRERHPEWTDRQLRNCLYWQGTARRQLREKVRELLDSDVWRVEYVPEAMGLNVTATCASVGVELEWPPVRVARQVAFIGIPRR